MCAPTYQQVIILQSLHDLRGPSPPSLVRHSLTQSVSRSGRTINQVHVLRLPLLLSSTAQQILITRGRMSIGKVETQEDNVRCSPMSLPIRIPRDPSNPNTHQPNRQRDRQRDTMSLIGHLDVDDRHDGLQQIQFLVLQRATPLVVVLLDEHVAR